MNVSRVTYQNFRSLSNEVFLPCEGVNIICGKNAAGKTTFLEGIYLFARGKSMRTTHDIEMITFGEEYTAVTLECISGGKEYILRMAYDTSGQRRFSRNGEQIKLLSEYIGTFRAVLFAPEHLSMVNDGPGVRRNYLNAAISQLNKKYITDLQRLNYAVRERNALLKRYDKSEFLNLGPVYAEQIAHYSALVAAERREYVDILNKYASDIMSEMSGGREKPAFRYTGQFDEEEYMKLLSSNTEREIKAGVTLYGAHRDELEITVNGKPARNYASQGQKRTISLAMKLSEGEISREKTGEYPVYLFDDVLSELDKDRRKYLLSETGGRQVIITSCEKTEEIKSDKYQTYNVVNGKIIN